MTIIGWVRQGDKAACGGVVIEGDPRCIGYGRPYTFQGAHMGCRKSCVIIEGVANSLLPNGCSRVTHGMLTSRGCPLESTLNDIDGIQHEIGQPFAKSFKPGNDGEWIPVYAPLMPDECDYDQHIIIEDQDGNPLHDVPYQLVDARGAVIQGITQSDGKTTVVAGHYGDTLDCDIGKDPEA